MSSDDSAILQARAQPPSGAAARAMLDVPAVPTDTRATSTASAMTATTLSELNTAPGVPVAQSQVVAQDISVLAELPSELLQLLADAPDTSESGPVAPFAPVSVTFSEVLDRDVGAVTAAVPPRSGSPGQFHVTFADVIANAQTPPSQRQTPRRGSSGRRQDARAHREESSPTTPTGSTCHVNWRATPYTCVVCAPPKECSTFAALLSHWNSAHRDLVPPALMAFTY
jgi:hypothetical protein